MQMRSEATMPNDATFLLVEDDEIDVIAIRRAFRQLNIGNDLIVANNGMEALSLLKGEAGATPPQRPIIILLDLNMPKMNGIEFLDQLRQDRDLTTTVVFVLTTSNDNRDRQAAYERHVAGYIVKETAEASILEAISMIDHYGRVVELP